ncbi:MAG: PTS sugar transporter subunit IIA [Myxococcaceae bacterium]
MVGLVVAAHGRLAEALLATAEQIVGRLAFVGTVSIEPGSAPVLIRQRIQTVVASVDQGLGVIVLVDLFGGTPCKESLMLCDSRDIEVVCGVNLPMLLKAEAIRQDAALTLAEKAQALARYGQKNITCASELMRGTVATRGA